MKCGIHVQELLLSNCTQRIACSSLLSGDVSCGNGDQGEEGPAAAEEPSRVLCRQAAASKGLKAHVFPSTKQHKPHVPCCCPAENKNIAGFDNVGAARGTLRLATACKQCHHFTASSSFGHSKQQADQLSHRRCSQSCRACRAPSIPAAWQMPVHLHSRASGECAGFGGKHPQPAAGGDHSVGRVGRVVVPTWVDHHAL